MDCFILLMLRAQRSFAFFSPFFFFSLHFFRSVYHSLSLSLSLAFLAPLSTVSYSLPASLFQEREEGGVRVRERKCHCHRVVLP